MTSASAKTEATRRASTTEAVLAGAVSGGVTRLLVAPLDLLKIRFQVQSPTLSTKTHDGLQYSTLLQAVRSVYAEEGLRSFWRGNVAASGLWVGYSALQFAMYRVLTHCWKQDEDSAVPTSPPGLISAANGAVAGITATVVTYPLDLFRTAFASQGTPRRFPTMRTLALHIWETQGPRGFYSGLGATIFQIAPYMGLSFGIYSTLKEVAVKRCSKQEDSHIDAWVSLSRVFSYVGSGVVAGFVSKLVVYPLDTVKKCMQMRHVPRCGKYGVVPMYSSSWACFCDVFEREGLRGLYKGTIPSLLKSVVAASTTFTTYELTLEALQYSSIHRERAEWTDVKTFNRK